MEQPEGTDNFHYAGWTEKEAGTIPRNKDIPSKRAKERASEQFYRLLQNLCQKLSQPIPWFLYPNRGVLYIKQNVPIMAIGGSKDFGSYQPGPELRPVKVVTVTLGHPVYLCNHLEESMPLYLI